MKLKIGHCQLACAAGDYEANLNKVLSGLEEAASDHLDIVSFPECFLTGYFRTAEQARRNSFALDGPEVEHLLRLDRQARGRAVWGADPGEEQAKVVVDLRHRADGRARIMTGCLLLDGNGRRKSLDQVDIGFVHPFQKLSGIGGKRFHVSALSFGIYGVECQR